MSTCRQLMRYVDTSRDMSRYVGICQHMTTYVDICRHIISKHIGICRNIPKCGEICRNVYNMLTYVQIHPNASDYIQIYFQIPPHTLQTFKEVKYKTKKITKSVIPPISRSESGAMIGEGGGPNRTWHWESVNGGEQNSLQGMDDTSEGKRTGREGDNKNRQQQAGKTDGYHLPPNDFIQ